MHQDFKSDISSGTQDVRMSGCEDIQIPPKYDSSSLEWKNLEKKKQATKLFVCARGPIRTFPFETIPIGFELPWFKKGLSRFALLAPALPSPPLASPCLPLPPLASPPLPSPPLPPNSDNKLKTTRLKISIWSSQFPELQRPVRAA